MSNSKNSYGSYIGFAPFVVTEKQMENTASRRIIFKGNENWLFRETNKARLKFAGCGEA